MSAGPSCFRCGTPCVPCSCAPCPRCDVLLCATCDLPYEPKGLRRDLPLPAHAGPRRCAREKPLEPIEIRPIEAEDFRRDYNSYELLPVGDGATAVSAAILSCFFAAGV